MRRQKMSLFAVTVPSFANRSVNLRNSLKKRRNSDRIQRFRLPPLRRRLRLSQIRAQALCRKLLRPPRNSGCGIGSFVCVRKKICLRSRKQG